MRERQGTIRTRLLMGFAAIAFVAVAVAANGLLQVERMHGASQRYFEEATPRIAELVLIQAEVGRYESAVASAKLAAVRGEEVPSEFLDQAARSVRDIDRAFTMIALGNEQAGIPVEGCPDCLETMSALFPAWVEVTRQDAAALGGAHVVPTSSLDGLVLPEPTADGQEAELTPVADLTGPDAVRGTFRARLRRLSDLYLSQADRVREDMEAVRSAAVAQAVGGSAIALLMAIAIAVVTSRGLTERLSRAAAYADRVAAGDLSATQEDRGNDEIGTLTRAVETMKDNLVRRLTELREMGGRVTEAAEEVASTAAVIAATANGLMDKPDPKAEATNVAALAGKLRRQAEDLEIVARRVR